LAYGGIGAMHLLAVGATDFAKIQIMEGAV
jgi:hypothetical protein